MAREREGAAVTLGVRPHDLRELQDGAAAMVNVVEITGESTLLHLDWHGHALHMQMAGRHAAGSGATLNIGFNPRKIHLFDAESGLRLPEN
ncbi:ABC transporter-like protein [Plautia stali symbiont]|nr:ABC transporter-like protein [Plautia stali symbiont]